MTVTPTSARAATALAQDVTAITALLERFGMLLTEALDAAERGEDEDFAVAVAERGRIVTALGNRLATLALARHVAQRDGVPDVEIASVLRPLDAALDHAQLLHDHLEDEAPARGNSRRGSALVLLR